MARFKDLTGQRFGMLTVVEQAESKGDGTRWWCRCDCGKLTSVRAGNLKSGQTHSCGCTRRVSRANDQAMLGQRFGRLVCVERRGTNNTKSALYLFRCDCGKEVVIPGARVRSKGAQSCGCQRVDSSKVVNLKHGMTRTSAYTRWENMKQRCLNPKNSRWADYGGRGITIYQPWVDSFEAYYKDVGDAPSPHVTLDRIDNDLGYFPGNVRWSTHSAQMKNRRPIVRATKVEVAALRKEVAELKAELARSRLT